MTHTPTLARRLGIEVLRLPSRTLEIPGWFPLVVERVHPFLVHEDGPVELETVGVRMRVDVRDYVQRRIFYEAHEHREIDFVRRFLRPGDTVVDVGAHVGLFTLLSAKAVTSSGEIHSFEPVPANFASLVENVRLNRFDHVRLNEAAAGRGGAELELGQTAIQPDQGLTSAMYTSAGDARRITVRKVDLGEYLNENLRNRPIRLIKLDVEGMEPEVLLALEQRLAEGPPDAFMIEVNVERLRINGWEVGDVSDPLARAGFGFFTARRGGGLSRLTSLPDPAARTLEHRSGVLRLGLQTRHWLYNVIALAPRVDGRHASG